MENIVVAVNDSSHQIPQQSQIKKDESSYQVNKSGIIAIDDSISQQKQNVGEFELNSVSKYMKQEGQLNKLNDIDSNNCNIIEDLSDIHSRDNLDQINNNITSNSVVRTQTQIDKPKINIIKSESIKEDQEQQNEINEEASFGNIEEQQQDQKEVQGENQLIDFDNIEEMKIIAQAVSSIQHNQDKMIENCNNQNQHKKMVSETDMKLQNFDKSHIEFDRSYINMNDHSKLNSANQSMIGIDSNTSRFIVHDFSSNTRRDATFINEDQEKDISALQRINDNTHVPLNNHDFDQNMQTFQNQLDQSQFNNIGNSINLKNMNIATSQELNKKLCDNVPESTNNAIGSTHIGLTSTTERQVTNKYKMRQRQLNLQINVEEIEKQEQKRQAIRARIQEEQLKKQQQQQQQQQISIGNQNNNANEEANRQVNEENIQLKRKRDNQNEHRNVQNGTDESNMNQNNNDESQFENNLSNQIFQKTLIVQLKLCILSVLGFLVFFDEKVINNIFIFVSLIIFMIFFYKGIIAIRVYNRIKILNVQDKFQLVETCSLFLLFVALYIVVQNFHYSSTLVLIYTPFIHIFWWRSVMKRSNSSSFITNIQLFFRIFVFIQCFIIALRYDKFIQWDWLVVFIPCWLLLVGFIFYFIQIFILTVWYYINFLRGQASSTDAFGFLWGMISFTIYAVCFYFGTVSLMQYFDNQGYVQIQKTMLLYIIMNFCLLLFDILFRERIKKYIFEQNREKLREEQLQQNQEEIRRNIENNIQNIIRQSGSTHSNIEEVQQNNQKIKKKYLQSNIKSRNFNIPLFMVQNSTTYFRQVDQIKKDIENQQNEIIDTNRIGNTQRQLREIANMKEKETITDRQKDQSLASRNMLMNHLSNQNESNLNGLPIERLENLINSPKKDMIYQQKTFNQTRHAQLPNNRVGQQRNSVKSDQNQIYCPSVKSFNSDKEQQTCLVCFVNQPNSVLMPCGHGGICADCAKDVCKKNGCCYLCRQEIQNIYQLESGNNNNNQGKYRKVIGITEVRRKQKKKRAVDSTNQIN
ncbi:zinc finger, C3HC4 type (RING finger) protein (macronuclear) [Tetrahymena thermophila SB210]|uniref:Zinc finger, C3HC4 type (RING finger) protein n=1 Tax=Tetrahymena thermophila (strain SB210) TaxID=312017 RepID=I7M125_TETTS|nr:zinc finger, C3HC4 type (RING finger) protein [Tetrahymena thermophila SB210]EAR93895.2 zinc finger, C3HC4 type (RING finger) protein [Tetrahymena thermophila SB210]|eukprot:XP_001014140.2 zinc finger, C3HC4 type (RING finger) protein [Tetrahymena thermophila SB210]